MQLNNEVSDFKVIISSVADIYRQQDSATGSKNEVLCRALVKGCDVVLELESLIEYELTRVAPGGHSKVKKSAWMQAERKIQEFKQRFFEVKADLNLGLSITQGYHIAAVLRSN